MSVGLTTSPTSRESVAPGFLLSATALRKKHQRGIAFAFTSVRKGEGVSHSVHTLRNQLSQSLKSKAVVITGLTLGDLEVEPEHRSLTNSRGTVATWFAGGAQDAAAVSWLRAEGSFLDRLRDQYDYVLIDCGALESSGDVFRIGPYVDGVVLVVEAGRTDKRKVQAALRTLGTHLGNVAGCILNRRTYPIPRFLYRFL